MKKLGEILLERGLVTREDLDRALEIQRERGDKLGRILVDLGFIAQKDLLQALSDQLGVPLAHIDGPPAVSPETERLSSQFLRQAKILPLRLEGQTLTLAMADPLDFETLSAARMATGLDILPEIATESEILDALERYYGEADKESAVLSRDGEEAAADLEHLRDMASE
ncbi:MAG: type II secretion system protein GspE, partial [Bryobacteraceae bacterium]